MGSSWTLAACLLYGASPAAIADKLRRPRVVTEHENQSTPRKRNKTRRHRQHRKPHPRRARVATCSTLQTPARPLQERYNSAGHSRHDRPSTEPTESRKHAQRKRTRKSTRPPETTATDRTIEPGDLKLVRGSVIPLRRPSSQNLKTPSGNPGQKQRK